mmetsp:Transcript_578/g.1374  ORF Transcript_578/g.1374 Transcript_578/m.1374 type:complete len:89 (+) Transcript_578:170-436(+)
MLSAPRSSINSFEKGRCQPQLSESLPAMLLSHSFSFSHGWGQVFRMIFCVLKSGFRSLDVMSHGWGTAQIGFSTNFDCFSNGARSNMI